MNSDTFYFMVGAICAGVIGLGVWAYQDRGHLGFDIASSHAGAVTER